MTHIQQGGYGMVTVSDLMTKKLVTVPAGTSAADAARVMNERHVGSVFIE